MGGGAHARGTAFTVDDIPFPETRAYVQRVLTAERDYRSKYAAQLGCLDTTSHENDKGAAEAAPSHCQEPPGWSVTA